MGLHLSSVLSIDPLQNKIAAKSGKNIRMRMGYYYNKPAIINPNNSKPWKGKDAEERHVPLEVRAFDVDSGVTMEGPSQKGKKEKTGHELRVLACETPKELQAIIGTSIYVDALNYLASHPL